MWVYCGGEDFFLPHPLTLHTTVRACLVKRSLNACCLLAGVATFLVHGAAGAAVHEVGAALRVDRGSSLLGMCRAIKAAGSLFPLAKWLYLHSPTRGMCRHQRNGFFFLIKVLLLLGPVIWWYVEQMFQGPFCIKSLLYRCL